MDPVAPDSEHWFLGGTVRNRERGGGFKVLNAQKRQNLNEGKKFATAVKKFGERINMRIMKGKRSMGGQGSSKSKKRQATELSIIKKSSVI